MTRQATNRLLELIEEGALDQHTVLLAALNHMSEDDVADMARRNEFLPRDEEEENED